MSIVLKQQSHGYLSALTLCILGLVGWTFQVNRLFVNAVSSAGELTVVLKVGARDSCESFGVCVFDFNPHHCLIHPGQQGSSCGVNWQHSKTIEIFFPLLIVVVSAAFCCLVYLNSFVMKRNGLCNPMQCISNNTLALEWCLQCQIRKHQRANRITNNIL